MTKAGSEGRSAAGKRCPPPILRCRGQRQQGPGNSGSEKLAVQKHTSSTKFHAAGPRLALPASMKSTPSSLDVMCVCSASRTCQAPKIRKLGGSNTVHTAAQIIKTEIFEKEKNEQE